MLDHDAEIDRNYDAFKKVVGSLMASHAGEFAVVRDGKVDAFYRSAPDALIAAFRRFPDGAFSVQEVADKPLDLGF